MTYCPVFKGVRKILKEFNLLLTPEQAYKRVLSEVPITGFKNAKSLKDNLVRVYLHWTEWAVLNHVRGKSFM